MATRQLININSLSVNIDFVSHVDCRYLGQKVTLWVCCYASITMNSSMGAMGKEREARILRVDFAELA